MMANSVLYGGLEINHRYFVDFFENRFKHVLNEAKALDFGCGDGRIIKAARTKGYQFLGADTFYGGDHDYQSRMVKGDDNHIVAFSKNGQTPFPNNYFDYIYSNQVFEHVEDVASTLDELHRILKPNGVMVHNFPVAEYFVEGHFGVPFFHWFSKSNWARMKYASWMYELGYGYNKMPGLKKSEWLRKSADFIDTKCFYRSLEETMRVFNARFTISRIDKEKLLYHLNARKGMLCKLLTRLVAMTPGSVVQMIEMRRGSITLLCRKRLVT